MTAAPPGNTKWLALALLAMTQFVIVLDASIVNVALPSIGRALDFNQDDLSWVVNAYTLTFGGFLLLGGRLADLVGRRRIFIGGLILFSAASLLGGLAQSDIWLIAARAVQGLGAAIISPAALSLVTTMFAEGSERNRALGVWGAVAGSGGAAGVLLGGILTEYAGWEWVLFVNVPIGVAAAFAAPRLLPESRDAGIPRVFDLAGATTVTAGLALLVYALVDANNAGWGSTQTLGLIAISIVLLVAFVVIESRTSHPLMPFSIFRLRTLRGADIVGLLIGMSLFAMFFFLSLYMQQVLGYDALKTGFAYLPLALNIIVSAGVASQLVTRIGFKPTLVAGMVLIGVGLVWFAQVSPNGSYVSDLLFPSLVVAWGLGLAFVPVTIAAVTARGRTRRDSRPGSSTPPSRSAARSAWRSSRPWRTAARASGRVRRPQPGGRADRGLPGRVPRRRGVRPRRCGARGGDDLLARQPGARRGRAPRRGGPGHRRRVTGRRRSRGGRAWHDAGVPALSSVCVFCGSNPGADPRYVEAAAAVGRTLARARHAARLRRRPRRDDGRARQRGDRGRRRGHGRDPAPDRRPRGRPRRHCGPARRRLDARAQGAHGRPRRRVRRVARRHRHARGAVRDLHLGPARHPPASRSASSTSPGYYAPLEAMLDHSVEQGFLHPETRGAARQRRLARRLLGALRGLGAPARGEVDRPRRALIDQRRAACTSSPIARRASRRSVAMSSSLQRRGSVVDRAEDAQDVVARVDERDAGIGDDAALLDRRVVAQERDLGGRRAR